MNRTSVEANDGAFKILTDLILKVSTDTLDTYTFKIDNYLKNQTQLKNNLENHMNMLQENQSRVKKYFMHKDINYAA